MAPAVVAVDEIGGDRDIRALETVLRCGCRILATVHGISMEDVRQRPLLGKLVSGHVFERYVVLEGGRAGRRAKFTTDGAPGFTEGVRKYAETSGSRVLLLAACGGWGFSSAWQLRQRLADLRELRRIASVLRQEIAYRGWRFRKRCGGSETGQRGSLKNFWTALLRN